jgi:hypothetical protein
MEGLNSQLIRQGLPQGERLVKLNNMAIAQLKSLMNATLPKPLENPLEKPLE